MMEITHRFAENYRGYNEYIDSLIDKVNENFKNHIEYGKKLDKTNSEQIEEYINLVSKTDESFDFLYTEVNKLEENKLEKDLS